MNNCSYSFSFESVRNYFPPIDTWSKAGWSGERSGAELVIYEVVSESIMIYHSETNSGGNRSRYSCRNTWIPTKYNNVQLLQVFNAKAFAVSLQAFISLCIIVCLHVHSLPYGIIIPPPQDENTSAMLGIVRLIYMYTCVREVKGDLWNERYHRELFREENVRFIWSLMKFLNTPSTLRTDHSLEYRIHLHGFQRCGCCNIQPNLTLYNTHTH